MSNVSRIFTNSQFRLIERYGDVCTYKRNSVSDVVFDIDTGNVIDSTNEELQFKMFISKPSFSELTNPAIVDKKSAAVLISGKSISFKPEIGDVIVSSDSTYSVISVHAYRASDSIPLWRLVCVLT